MRHARWIIPPKIESPKPVIYHCISRVVNREFVFGDLEREQQRMFMRMYENFSGCRVLAYCFMSNHFHILLEVTPLMAGGLPDAELLKRLRAIHTEEQVAEVAVELAAARAKIRLGLADGVLAAAIHERYTHRMHDLSQFMKGFIQRYTQWHNRAHRRTGRLWEDRFKSVIVEDGVASKTMAAYIDLNPVRAGMVKDPAQYRWSSYGEAVCGGARGNGKKARAGLVRALRAHNGVGADAGLWAHDVSREYRRILLAGAVERQESRVGRGGGIEVKRTRKGMSVEEARREKERREKRLEELPYGRMLRCRVRYFTDGAVIGSRVFVNEAFANARERFSKARKDGARTMRGSGSGAKGLLWTMRDLQKGIT
jgi:REP element-mobilizing transposase RayT